MNKVLVFTNADRWYDLCNRFNVDEYEWNERFHNISNDLIYKCGINSNHLAVLEKTPDISLPDEGVYLVYDSINNDILSTLLNQCKQDNLYVLTHNTGVGVDTINRFDLYCTVLKGAHDGLSKHFYEKVFKILSDEKTDKTNRIIHSVFLSKIKDDFLFGCTIANNHSKSFDHACHTLQNIPHLGNIMNDFMVLYQNSHGSSEFEAKWKEIRDVLDTL